MSKIDPLDELEQQAKKLEENFDEKSSEENLDSIDSLLSSVEEKLEEILKSLTEE